MSRESTASTERCPALYTGEAVLQRTRDDEVIMKNHPIAAPIFPLLLILFLLALPRFVAADCPPESLPGAIGCCPADRCSGVCGGSLCATGRPGRDCCVNEIARRGNLCAVTHEAPCLLTHRPDILVRLVNTGRGQSLEVVGLPPEIRLNRVIAVDEDGTIGVPRNSISTITFNKHPLSEPFFWKDIRINEISNQDCVSRRELAPGLPEGFDRRLHDHPAAKALILIDDNRTRTGEYCYQIVVENLAGTEIDHDPKIYNMDTEGHGAPDSGESGPSGRPGETR